MHSEIQHTPQPDGKPLIIAHRGYSAIAPENTIASFEAAIQAGAIASECDVHMTADDHIVVSHDSTLDRCTDAEGEITQMTLAEIQGADAGQWKDAGYAGERVPTLQEVLQLIKSKMRLVVEIKQEGIVEAVLDVIHDMDAIRHCTIVSFSLDTCRRMRAAEPRLPVGWISHGVPEDDADAADNFIETALSANVQFVSVHYDGAGPALIRRAGVCGLSVWAWTANDPDLVTSLAARGIAGITTDDPEMALKTIAAT